MDQINVASRMATKRLRTAYLRAAKLVNDEHCYYSCSAIKECDAARLYSHTMSQYPEKRGLTVRDIYDAVDDEPFDVLACNLRVWLLCMMAAACGDFR